VKTYHLYRSQSIRAPIEGVFEFFSRAENLELLTPRWLGFRIRTPLPITLQEGARIEYRIRLAFLPTRWVSRIETWDPPHGFVDVQEHGPYRFWEHSHRFAPEGDGVRMTDEVRYALPLGPLGRTAHVVAVRWALRRIFDYRAEQVRKRFGESSAAKRSLQGAEN
jgi:ligand-binding SRPBCC domain-containing protein